MKFDNKGVRKGASDTRILLLRNRVCFIINLTPRKDVSRFLVRLQAKKARWYMK